MIGLAQALRAQVNYKMKGSTRPWPPYLTHNLLVPRPNLWPHRGFPTIILLRKRKLRPGLQIVMSGYAGTTQKWIAPIWDIPEGLYKVKSSQWQCALHLITEFVWKEKK